jgi:hypothetical protein
MCRKVYTDGSTGYRLWFHIYDHAHLRQTGCSKILPLTKLCILFSPYPYPFDAGTGGLSGDKYLLPFGPEGASKQSKQGKQISCGANHQLRPPIGDGTTTYAWDQNWLPCDERLTPVAALKEDAPKMVSDYIDSACAAWNVQKLEEFFLATDGY